MKTKAIFFDKDGTLMDFGAFWLPVARAAIGNILEAFNVKGVTAEEILAASGARDEEIDINGLLCSGTYEVIAKKFHEILTALGASCSFSEVAGVLAAAYSKNYRKGVLKPACDNLAEVLKELRKSGISLVLVTADKPQSALSCLKGLDISEFFDAIYSDDGKTPPKPDPFCITDFCQRNKISPRETVMVGDTLNDMVFAKNGGARAVGVAKTERNRKALLTAADEVIPDVSYLLKILK